MSDHRSIYRAIAQSLREFGYPGVSENMVGEVHDAMLSGAEIPHGVVGMFARRQLKDLGLGSDKVADR